MTKANCNLLLLSEIDREREEQEKKKEN